MCQRGEDEKKKQPFFVVVVDPSSQIWIVFVLMLEHKEERLCGFALRLSINLNEPKQQFLSLASSSGVSGQLLSQS